jgi:hypothetical protein
VKEERTRMWEIERGPSELGILLEAEVASSSSFDSSITLSSMSLSHNLTLVAVIGCV